MLMDLTGAGFGIVYQGQLEVSSQVDVVIELANATGNGSKKRTYLKSSVVWRDPKTNRYGMRLLAPPREADEEALKSISNAFVYQRTVYLPDTNAEGNVYFARYFEWQGEVREAYLGQGISKEEYRALVVTKTRMVTANASMDYARMLWLFDNVSVRMTTRNIRRASLEIAFAFFNAGTGELVARGTQQLAFQNRRAQLIPIPPPIRRLALAIEEKYTGPVQREQTAPG